jgi:hypothetical protein
LAGGVLEELHGGNFGNGFITAGLTKAANINGRLSGDGVVMGTARVAAAAVLGGTISQLTGGKFANGARTAGFAQLFNGNFNKLKNVFKSAITSQRRAAVKEAWDQEIALVKGTGQGSRAWSKPEIELLKQGIRPSSYQGHHINSVKDFPELAGDPRNIKFLTRSEHFLEHGFNWRNMTTGPLIDRTFGWAAVIGTALFQTLDRFDPTSWAEQAAIQACNNGDLVSCGSLQYFGTDTQRYY